MGLCRGTSEWLTSFRFSSCRRADKPLRSPWTVNLPLEAVPQDCTRPARRMTMRPPCTKALPYLPEAYPAVARILAHARAIEPLLIIPAICRHVMGVRQRGVIPAPSSMYPGWSPRCMVGWCLATPPTNHRGPRRSRPCCAWPCRTVDDQIPYGVLDAARRASRWRQGRCSNARTERHLKGAVLSKPTLATKQQPLPPTSLRSGRDDAGPHGQNNGCAHPSRCAAPGLPVDRVF